MIFNCEGIVWATLKSANDRVLYLPDESGQSYPVRKSSEFRTWLNTASLPEDFYNKPHAFKVKPRTFKRHPNLLFNLVGVDLTVTEPIEDSFLIKGRVFYQNKTYNYILIDTKVKVREVVPMKLVGQLANERAVDKLFIIEATRVNDSIVIKNATEVDRNENAIIV